MIRCLEFTPIGPQVELAPLLPALPGLLAGAGFDYVILPQGCDEVGVAGHRGVDVRALAHLGQLIADTRAANGE